MKNNSLPKSGKRRLIIIPVVLFVLIILVAGLVYLKSLSDYKRDVASIDVRNVDLQTIEDGTYFGDCNVGYIRVKVRVVIKDHTMTEIELIEHKNDRGGAANALPDRILEQQRIDVDAVSGATSSSRVIQEAIYNALTGERTVGDIVEDSERS